MRGIYEIRNVVTGDHYIGMSGRVEARWHQHLRALACGRHVSTALQRAWEIDGAAAFTFRVLEIIPDLGACEERERQLIRDQQPAYNTANTERAIDLGRASAQRRISSAARVRKHSPSLWQQMSEEEQDNFDTAMSFAATQSLLQDQPMSDWALREFLRVLDVKVTMTEASAREVQRILRVLAAPGTTALRRCPHCGHSLDD